MNSDEKNKNDPLLIEKTVTAIMRISHDFRSIRSTAQNSRKKQISDIIDRHLGD